MRLCCSPAVPAGRARLLGQLHAPEVPVRSPRVLGVDDFAFRRSAAPAAAVDGYLAALCDILGCTPNDLIDVQIANAQVRKAAEGAAPPPPPVRRSTTRRPDPS